MRSKQQSTDFKLVHAIDPAIVLQERAEATALLDANGMLPSSEDLVDAPERLAEDNRDLEAIGNEQSAFAPTEPPQMLWGPHATSAKIENVLPTEEEDDYCAILVKRLEMQDPRDRWKHTGEPPPALLLGEYGIHTTAAPPDRVEPLPLVSPSLWKGVPIEPMHWLATDRIPGREVKILGGDGGAGKTTIALQLAIAIAQGLGDWLGTATATGPVIFFSAEEPESEVRRRLGRLAKRLDFDPDTVERLHFHFAEPDSCLLGSIFMRQIAPTPTFRALAAAIAQIKPALLIVDSVAAVFGGDQNDRRHVRTFISMFKRLARDAGCAILLLDHPSLSGIANGSGRAGSVDWQNATRARLHLHNAKHSEDGTGRVLETMKSNYGPTGRKIALRWEDGCFVPEGSVPTPERTAAFAAVDEAYLNCLDVCTAQRQNVYPKPGRSYAPRVFATMQEAMGRTDKALASAQERLFKAGRIHTVSVGAPSRNLQRIERRP
jgi:RecA-family ATPase